MVIDPIVKGLAGPPIDDIVHVFLAELDVSAEELDRLSALLSVDEHERARRLIFDRDRKRFIVARGQLRTIFAQHLWVSARSIRFCYALGGKPALDATGQNARAAERPNFTFNVSHSDGLTLIAIGREGEIGVDVERVWDDFETADIEPHCLAQSEIATLGPLQPTARRRAFFQCWVRKEAYLKAIGAGITVPLAGVAVEPRTDTMGVSRVVTGDVTTGWEVHDLFVPTVTPRQLHSIALDESPCVLGLMNIGGWVSDSTLSLGRL